MVIANKKILVAGSSGLFGKTVIKRLINEGAKIIAVDLCESQLKNYLKKDEYDQVEFYKADLNNSHEMAGLFSDLQGLDGAINATYPRGNNYGRHFLDVELNDFNENVKLQLGSAFYFMQSCAKYFLRTQKEFSLINMSSIYGVVPPKFEIYKNTGMTTPVEYAAIKSAIIHLTKYVSKYIGDTRFRVNCVSYGGILDGQDKKFIYSYTQQTHGAGMLVVDEIMGAVIFLLSAQSQYITGQNIIVDDGFVL